MITADREMYTKHYSPPFAKGLSSCTQSFIHLSIIITIVWVLNVLLFPFNASAQSANKVVTVVGFGSTPNEARNDAVRQALQETMQQLIVVDRAIKDDQLIRDKIMSTMNGYVENFKELSIKKEGQQIAVQAEVTVSPSRIENFIGVSIGGGGSVSGSSLFAESQREIAQRKARGEIFDRLFRGFPSEVMEVTIDSIRPDEHDLSFFSIDVTISYSQSWINALKSGLRAVQDREISVEDLGPFTRKNPNYYSVIIIERDSTKITLLPPGDYLSNFEESLTKQNISLNDQSKKVFRSYDTGGGNSWFWRYAYEILDDSGNSVKTNRGNDLKDLDSYVLKGEGGPTFMFTVPFKPKPNERGVRRTNTDNSIVYIDINPKKIKGLRVPSRNFNAAAATKVVLLPILFRTMGVHRVVMDVLSDNRMTISDVYGDPMARAVLNARLSPDKPADSSPDAASDQRKDSIERQPPGDMKSDRRKDSTGIDDQMKRLEGSIVGKCGDGICSFAERLSGSCPQDCK